MNPTAPGRFLSLLWVAAFLFLIALWLFPLSTRLTRTGGVALLAVVWFGLIVLCWRKRILRYSLLGITTVFAGLLILPARKPPAPELLRSEFVAGLRRYDGVRYYWGGESPTGIDCSGLVRRGLIDSLFCRGVRTFDPGLVRRSLSLWWRDCTASALGEARGGLTVQIFDTPSVNELDHSKVLPGDLAVTSNGLHIMAYVGDKTWIEADPGEGRVISVPAPAKGNVWFNTPMKIVRWRVLSE